MRQMGPMKYSGPSARRNAGASPGRIQSRTSGMSVMRSDANSPSCGRTGHRIACIGEALTHTPAPGTGPGWSLPNQGLGVERPVFEGEYETGLDRVASHDLREISLGELLVVRRAQRGKRARHAFRIANGHGAGNGATDVRDRESKAENCHSRPAH